MRSPATGTVLNVNDTEASRYLSTATLRLAGHQVIEATSGREALERAEADQPDIVLLDIKLPDLDGYTVCERIKAHPRTAHIAVIHTSATYVTAEKKVRGLQSGADVYLTQPFHPEELTATVASVLRVRVLEQESRRRARQLEELDRRKDEFLAMLAHELRNPLAAINTAVALARQGDTPDTQPARMHDIIQRQTRHLVRMVDDLLEVSRITRGHVELRRARVDLGALLQQVLEHTRPVMERRGLVLHVPSPQAPVWMEGDAHRLEQIFGNLLDNALKYTRAPGTVAVTLDTEVAEGRRWARVTVKDSGVGMERDLLARVFEPFVQADRSLDRELGGLGIGLMLVHQFVGLHGGEVTAASEGLDKGSAFSVRLPVEAGDEARAESALPAPDAAAPEAEPRRILLVEDNEDARLTLSEMLELWGHDVEVASDGLEGVTKALQRTVRLAVVDIGLPGLDGYAVAERLRAQRGQDIRLIALTGYGAPEAKRRALDAGFDVHLTKPVNLEELARLLRDLSPP
ncbi:response regulator [Melittangium boletus]|uniref:response regulator n=1 Tax=Melittangium boletus TaxID=83453 RepID=UPI003DA42848